MKVQLIQPTIGEYDNNSRSGCYPPLGLISIATFIRQECPSVEVEILDGELLSQQEIIARVDADIVGLNTNTVTYPQALQVAAHAKALGARVVLGGVYASALPEVILHKRASLIDTVVVGYGEKPMVQIIRGCTTPLMVNHTADFRDLPLPDRSLVDLNSYVERFRLNHPSWGRRGTHLFTSVGCTWREQTQGGCIFCSRSGDRFSSKQPARIWEEVRRLIQEYAIDYIVDFSDSILQDSQWLADLVQSKPRDIDVPWHVFGRVDQINPIVLDLLTRLPCVHIFVGIESGDPSCHASISKGGGSPSASLVAAQLLTDYNIPITPSYVLGLPGETYATLNRSLRHAQQLSEITGFEEAFCCELIPFPGSRAFAMLTERFAFASDVLSIEHLKSLWTHNYTSVAPSVLAACVDEILSLAKYPITIRRKASYQVRNIPRPKLN